MIEELVYEILAAALPAWGSPPEEIVSADRILVPGDWQEIARPYIVHFPVTVKINYAHGSALVAREWTYYQVSIFAETYDSARSIADIIIQALNGKHDDVTFFLGGQSTFFEPETGIHQVALNWTVMEPVG